MQINGSIFGLDIEFKKKETKQNRLQKEDHWNVNFIKRRKGKKKQMDYRRRTIRIQIPASLQVSFYVISMKPSAALALHADVILSNIHTSYTCTMKCVT